MPRRDEITTKQLSTLKDSIPFSVRVYDTQTRKTHIGEVRGRLLPYPIVTLSDGRKFEYSWTQVYCAVRNATDLII